MSSRSYVVNVPLLIEALANGDLTETKRAELDGYVEALLRMAELVTAAGFASCNTVHGGYPKGFTCLDVQRFAAEHSDGYGVAFRNAILAGKHLCWQCQIRQVFESLKGK
jgi:hypothetical protein